MVKQDTQQQRSQGNTDTLTQVYLVGGAVRDRLLGLPAFDKDYVVVGESVETMRKLGFKPVGKDFPVFLHPSTKDEYALARTERKTGSGYAGFSVDASKAVTLEEDLARRDLTINAMAQDAQGNIIDPFNGQLDLNNKVLRHTTDAFIEDPVRVLRVARFLARFGPEWKIHSSTIDLFTSMKDADELAHLVPERVWKETEKALKEPYPSLYFTALLNLGIFPELEMMQGVPQPPSHHPEGDVLTHTLLVLQRAADVNFDLPTRFAALTHDFGKALVYEKYQHLRGHELAGKAAIEAFCQRLRVPNKLKELALLTSEYHLHCHRIFELKATTLYTLIIETFNAVKQPLRFQQFIQACQCDAQGRGEERASQAYLAGDFALFLQQGLQALDTKQVVADAIAQGKSGVLLGQAVKQAQISTIKHLKQQYKTSPSG